LTRTINIPDLDTLLRYASPNRTHRSDDGAPEWLLPQAFDLREDEVHLSLTWVEFFEGSRDEQIKAAIDEFRQSMMIRPNGAFGLATAAAIKEAGDSVTPAQQLRILHEPVENNRAHASVHRYPRDNLHLREALARQAFTTVLHVAKFLE
jgi:hypothetical protein